MAIVWQISIVHFPKKLLLKGVLLEKKPYDIAKKINSFKNLINVGRLYSTGVCANTDIKISIDNFILDTSTNRYGEFSVLLDSIPLGDIRISYINKQGIIEIVQSYPVYFKETNSSFDVISDIDDTIVYSYSADFFRRITTLAFTKPTKRKPTAFIQNLFSEFIKKDIRVFYISKSESNLFHILTSFIEHHKLPIGPLFLTPYLHFRQLFKSKAANFKIENIRIILENSSTKKFVLLGDDSQKDMEVYASIVKEFPERIIKIYIRQTKHKVSKKQQEMLRKLRETEIPLTYFKANNRLDVVNELIELNNNLK